MKITPPIFSGRHCCLLCNATYSEIQKCPAEQSDKITERTLETLKTKLAEFQAAGGIIGNAKLFDNVIHEPIVNIPLDQVKLNFQLFHK